MQADSLLAGGWLAQASCGFAGFVMVVASCFAAGPSLALDLLRIDAEPIAAFDPLNPNARGFGSLEFLGGLVMTSDHEEFGGISGLRFLGNDGRFIAITDRARVIDGRLLRQGDRPAGFAKTTISRVRGSNGRVITGAGDKDAEALELLGDRRVAVGYERNDRIGYFRFDRGRLRAEGADAWVDLNRFGFPENKGVEAIALQPGTGDLFVLAEHALNEAGNHRGFVVSGNTVKRGFDLVLRDRYSITDAQFLPDGDLLILERYYSLFAGVYLRLRRVSAARLGSDHTLDGEVLIEAGPGTEIDNMEAMAVSSMADGSTRITLISDDNFSPLQRSILLEFKLTD